MHILFLKILFFVTLLFLLGVCLKLGYRILAPALQKKRNLDCFKTLIDSGAFDIQTITCALNNYIPTRFQNTPPYAASGRNRPVKTRDLAKAVDLVLEHDSGPRYLLVLAESGAGKTSFVLNYYLRNFNRPQNRRHRIHIVPMGLENADDMILSRPEQQKTVLFLDGLNEDVSAFENPGHRLAGLIEAAGKYRKVIITCHLNFLAQNRSAPSRKGFVTIPATGENSDRYFELKRVYLAPPDIGFAKKIIHWDLPAWKTTAGKEIVSYIEKHPAVGFTPLILTYLNDIYKKETVGDSRNSVYQAIVESGIQKEKNWNDKTGLRQLLDAMAVRIYGSRGRYRQEIMSRENLEKTAGSCGVALKRFNSDCRSLIIEKPSGAVTFSHRSLLEFLFVRQVLAGNRHCFQSLLSDNMKLFLFEALRHHTGTDLSHEFQWLSRFPLKAIGIRDPESGQSSPSSSVLNSLISQKPSYRFLGRLNKLLQNPIFYEFGWNPQFNSHLQQAVYQQKTSLLKLSQKRWVVLIEPQKIEINMKGHHKVKILINEKDFQEYQSLEKETDLIALHSSIHLEGLRMFNSINQTGSLAVAPDLKNFKRVILYFKANADLV